MRLANQTKRPLDETQKNPPNWRVFLIANLGLVSARNARKLGFKARHAATTVNQVLVATCPSRVRGWVNV
jgi:hypothetical protein